MVTASFKINSELPNKAIYKFEGVFELQDHKIPLEAENIILRGSILRNTEFIYGTAVFTGHETKIMMNSTKAKMKFSNLDIITNKLIYVILGL